MAVDRVVLAEVLSAVGRQVPGVEPDRWAPSVQGAVGHVVGVRDRAGASYVLKVYPSEAAGRLETEVRAQRLLGEVPGLRVPRPVAYGGLPGSTGVGYLLMTRLDGVRWADRRSTMDVVEATGLVGEVGRTMRRVHSVPGPRFGGLADGSPGWATAWDRVADRTAELIEEFVRTGGPTELAEGVRRFVGAHRPAFASCPGPVLCHNDFIDSNLLVPASGRPRLRGVVDLERASWGDPLSDLAQTRLHVRQHRPEDTTVLTEGYGVAGANEHRRLDVHEVLHAVAERNWIGYDRPAGWRESIAALDAFVAART